MKSIQVARIWDSAFDRANTDAIAAYGVERCELPPCLPGKRPALFTISPIPRSLMRNYVESAENEAVRITRAFECAVSRVDDYKSFDGQELRAWTPTRANGNRGMTDEELDLFSSADIAEIGAVAYLYNFLPPDVERTYQLPHSSRVVLGAQELRRAVLNLKSALETSLQSKAPQPDQGPLPEKPEGPGEPPGGATAPESVG